MNVFGNFDTIIIMINFHCIFLSFFMIFADGEWDWDNYEVVSIAQKKNLPVTAIASVKYNIWCAIGNTIHVLHSHSLRTEVKFG